MRRCRVGPTLAVVAATVLLSACGDQTTGSAADDTAQAPASSPAEPTSAVPPPAPSPAPSPRPSQSASEPGDTEPEDTETTDAPPAPMASGPTAALLPAVVLPGLNDRTGWRETGTTRQESRRPGWVCQRFSLLSNGAVSAVERTYAATRGTSTATQVIGRTADRRSAERVFAVLSANAASCADQLRSIDRFPRDAVRPLAAVPVVGGRAAWGVVFSGPVRGAPDSAFIDAVAVVRVGDTVSVMSMTSIGQDYDYEPGQTPPELAVPLVAAALADR